MMPIASHLRSGRGTGPVQSGSSRSAGLLARWRTLVAAAVLVSGFTPSLTAADTSAAPRVWETQTFPLRSGWSAIYSHVDAGDATLDSLTAVNTDIEEIWRWNPDFSSLQFLDSPDQPSVSPGNWLVYRRSDLSSTLTRFVANAAYLVKLKANATQFQWSVKGSPVPVLYNWKSDGMNLIGFSTVTLNPPNLNDFLIPVPSLLFNTPIYQYRGGDLGASNPLQVITPRTTSVRRGEAFWVRATDATRYYGPFEIQLQDNRGVHFGDRLSSYQFVLRNVSSIPITVQARLIATESVPFGAEAIAAGTPTLLVRGNLLSNSVNHAYQTLNTATPRTWTLQPEGNAAAEATVVIGLDWSSLTGSPGALNGGILRFTDSAGQMQYDVPVTARVPDGSGLWVGEASVTHVQEALKSFRKSSDEGVVKANPVANNTNGTLSLVWLKRQPEGGTPPDASDLTKWYVVDGLFFRKLQKDYTGATLGSELLPPEFDEAGGALANPAFYWQARPFDVSFFQGYYYDEAKPAAVANGYRHQIDLIWETAAGVVNPANGTYPATQAASYEGALEGATLPPPSIADLNVVSAFWAARPYLASDPAPFDYDPDGEVATSRVNGDLTVVWLKSAPLFEAPTDASNTSKWLFQDGVYYRKLAVSYTGLIPGDVLNQPENDENGGSLGGDLSYWQPRPFHQSLVDGYEFDPATSKVVANGGRPNVSVLWLRVSTNSPAWGETMVYSNVVAGVELPRPTLAHDPVSANHWKPQPKNAPVKTQFTFTPSGAGYETTADGRYIQVSGSDALSKAAKSMPLRLIFHSTPTGNGQYAVKLLQRVYFSTDSAGKVVLATDPSLISSNTSPIRRMSTVQVPWTADNRAIACKGSIRFGVSGEMAVGYADPIANPFVHAYHPDHDNLDARFEQPLAQGEESYGVRRGFTLTPAAATLDFESLARGGDTYPGVYQETIRLEGKNGFTKEYHTQGGYLLRRIIPTPTLLVP